jgi:hypothetical protein
MSLLADALGRDEHRDGLADGFGGGVAENALGAGIPIGDDAVEGFADDRVGAPDSKP